MISWNPLSKALQQKGFSTAQIKKLSDQLGQLDAAEILKTPRDQLLAAMTGPTKGREQKLDTLLAAVNETQAGAPGVKAMPSQGRFLVTGQIRATNGKPLANVTVRAFDRDIGQEARLGQAVTDEEGKYQITVAPDQFIRPQRGAPHLVVRAFSPRDRLLGASEILFNAASGQAVDLEVEQIEEPPFSTYEILTARLAPLLRGHVLSDLGAEDGKILAVDAKVDVGQVEALRQSARLACEAGLPAGVLYALAGKTPPLELEKLLSQSDEKLQAALEAAFKENVIPALPDNALDEVLARFEELRVEKGLLLRHTISGQLWNRKNSKPLAGVTVRVLDLDALPRARERSVTSTDPAGEFAFAYTAPPHSQTKRTFRLCILDPQGKELHTVEVKLLPGQTKLETQIGVRLPTLERASPKVTDLATALRLNLAPALRTALKRHKIATLDDIRRTGGLDRLKDSGLRPHDPAVKRLQAHADLSILTDDVKLRDALIGKRYDSSLAIASTSRSSFVLALADSLPKDKAEQLHRLAVAQSGYSSSTITGMRAYKVNKTQNGKGGGADDGKEKPPLEDETATTCTCEACNSVVSPRAYLADLLDYTLKHVKRRSAGGQATDLNLNYLSNQLCTPFATLADSCAASETRIKQIRLLIEVLRRATANLPSGQVLVWLKRYEQDYRDKAYETLLIEMGTSPEELRQARGYASKDRVSLAQRLGFDLMDGATDRLEALTLQPNARTEDRLEKLFGLPPTTPPTSFTEPSPLKRPDLAEWRLKYLHTLWSRDDWQPELCHWDAPIVDPDLIGPDDFREISASAGTPFAQWTQRRDQIDALLKDLAQRAPDLNAMLRRAYGTAFPDFDHLATQINANPQPSDIAQTILTETSLGVEAFCRLLELRDTLSSGPALPENEGWSELASILAQAIKVRHSAFYQTWKQEEQQAGLSLDCRAFWQSPSEPKAGTWPPANYQERILVDPDLVAMADLRNGKVAGKTASELWQDRAAALETLASGLRELVPGTHLIGMIKLALELSETEDSISAELGRIHANLGDPLVFASGAATLSQKYYISVQDFEFLWTVKDSPVPGPAKETWDRVLSILKQAYKAKHNWKQAEGTAKYWEILHMQLAPWRATPVMRQAWQTSLTTNSRPPIIDPDLLDDDDFVRPVDENSAWLLFEGRTRWIGGERSNLQNRRQAVGAAVLRWFDQELATIGFGDAEFRELGEGGLTESVSARLGQIGLAPAAFARLLGLHRLLENGQTLEPQELVEIENVFVQARKLRQFPAWNAEEETEQITLSPGFFLIRSRDNPFDLTPWLGTAAARRSWEQKLASRRDQEKAVVEALESAVDAAEGAALSILRAGLVYAAYMQAHPVPDAMLTFADAPDNNQPTRYKWVTRHFLIDSEMAPCRETTRIQQATETLQQLLWSIRAGLRPETEPALELDNAERFDDEWRWLGTYPSWRAALLAFVYPENILLPSLRRNQTPGFSVLIEQLRSSGRVTPDIADNVAQAYSDYWLDVLDMQVEASITIQLWAPEPDLILLFGRGKTTSRVYWTSARPDCAPDYWAPVPGVQDVVASKVIGATQYMDPTAKLKVYLFVKGHKGGEAQLFLCTFEPDLLGETAGQWSGSEAQSLSLNRSGGWDALLALHTSSTTPPGLLIWGGTEGIAFRQLNPQGSDWDSAGSRPDTDFSLFWDGQNQRRPMSELTPLAILQQRLYPYEGGPYTFLLLAYDPKASETTELVALQIYESPTSGYVGHHQGAWELRSLSDWRGAYYWAHPSKRRLVAFRYMGSSLKYTSFRLVQNISEVEHPEHGIFVQPEMGSSVGWTRSAETYGSGGKVYFAYMRPVQHPRYTGVTCRPARLMHCVSMDAIGRPWLSGNTRSLVELVPLSTVNLPTPVTLDRSNDSLQPGQIELTTALNSANQDGLYGVTNARNRDYLQEAFYYVPTLIASKLQQSGYFIEAMDWYRKVCDYGRHRSNRFVFPPLKPDPAAGEIEYERLADWPLDPLDVHAIAATRPFTDTRFVLLSVIRCVLDYADAEFAQDTSESIGRARNLYLLALDLLDDDILRQERNGCDQIIGELTIVVGRDIENPAWNQLLESMGSLGYTDLLWQACSEIKKVMAARGSATQKLTQAKAVYQKLDREARSRGKRTFADTLARNKARGQELQRSMSSRDAWSSTMALMRGALAKADTPCLWGRGDSSLGAAAKDLTIPAPRYTFCISPNPILAALRLHAELNLYKLRTCRNIAGMERELEPYTTSIDAASSVPAIGAGGQITLPGAFRILPTLYRYRVLAERAKQLVDIARKMEESFLSLLERGETERYNLLKARQDARLARAGVVLQDLRVQESENGVVLADLQQERAVIQQEYYADLIRNDLLPTERKAMDALRLNVYLQAVVGAVTAGGAFTAGLAAGGVIGAETGPGLVITALAGGAGAAALAASLSQTAYSAISGLLATVSSLSSMMASYERRRQEWEFQQALAQQDSRIGTQQITLAEDRVRITGQEREIARVQVEHADDVIEFLNTKDTTAELYDWMSGVIEGVYRYFLQQATGIARLAENQLAFERQEIPPAFIQADYWEAPRDGSDLASDGENAPDRRGLTGSARLLQDIYRLDQYAFESDRRKLQLTKTVSLARLDPFAFQRFRETGIMVFATPMTLFDCDFPGHYLRLIKRVRTSVIALIPPTEGIKATLSTTGISQVVIGGELFQSTILNRGPESVALTSPQNATGLFDLEAQGQGEMLLPFEGLGVDSTWEFRLPKPANNLDFRSIADVLITIEYTALDSPIFRQQVIQRLDRRFSADRPFSFRYQFADAWYDLHHPDLVEDPQQPMTAYFSTRREDFPPNIADLKIQQITLYVARKSGTTDELKAGLRFAAQGSAGTDGGTAATVNGIISTRQVSAGGWTAMIGKSPVGEWTLVLDEPKTRELLERDLIEDILFVITFGGTTEAWPG